MDKVQVQLPAGQKVFLARVKDGDGVWLGMREVFNKLAPQRTWQAFHKAVTEGKGH